MNNKLKNHLNEGITKHWFKIFNRKIAEAESELDDILYRLMSKNVKKDIDEVYKKQIKGILKDIDILKQKVDSFIGQIK